MGGRMDAVSFTRKWVKTKQEELETAKKCGPEYRISLKTGLHWPKLAYNDQNASKFKNLCNSVKESSLSNWFIQL